MATSIQGMPSVIQASSMPGNSTTKVPGGPSFPQASAMASIAMPSRDRFYVELKPGETTFVSWKKLVKESQKTAGSSSEAPVGAHPALEARIAPQGESIGDELGDRFEVMDDDKYDTRDSFIDEADWDVFFSVDDARVKHSGSFINKGKLEKEIAQASTLAGPKKRKRKDLKKLSTNEVEAKKSKSGVRLKAAAREGPSPSKADISVKKKTKIFQGPGWERGKSIAMAVVEEELNSARANSMVVSAVNKTDAKQSFEGVMADRMIVDSVSGSVNVKDQSVGLIDINEPLKNDAMAIFEPRDPLSTNGLKSQFVQNDKDDMDGLLSSVKRLLMVGKEVTPGGNKGTALEKAFLDLEKDVAELYPPSSVNKEPEQGKRNRLPGDLKQKLAKVARLAAKQGRIMDDMIERLMGVLGHVIRERTLKRHLKAMIEMGMSAMQEKEGRLQGIKKEVTEMIKARVLKLQESHRVNDLQFLGASPEKASGEERYEWDHAMEDKICDLYEQYIEGMDEYKGPQLRKLYAELAKLWPDGWMDNSGIKLAVHRAKERKKQLWKETNSSDAKIKRRPMKPKIEDSSGDGLTLLELFTTGEKISDAEKTSSHGHDVHLLQEKKRILGKHGWGKSKSLDEALTKKKMKKVEKSLNAGDSGAVPLNMGTSIGHASFGSPVSSLSLPFDSPLTKYVGTPNGAHISKYDDSFRIHT